MTYRDTSMWLAEFPGELEPRPSLTESSSVDVAIVGGGFTGLWTAYYLTERAPDLSIAVLERDICGFGASGRNGGWAIGELACGVDGYVKHAGHDEAMRLVRMAMASVDEIDRVTREEGIDCRFEKGGAVYLARSAAQEIRQRELIEHERAHGFTDDEIRLLSAEEASAMVGATDVRGGIFYAPVASLDPARLVRALAEVVEARGVKIYEQTAVTAIEPGRLLTDAGDVSAPVVVRATEGYTRDLPGERRTLVPLYSLMIATEPLPAAVFEEIGMAGRPTWADARYAVIYGQRTADNRLAFGGRGVPYVYGSRIDPEIERHGPTHQLLERTLTEMFPILAEARITHRWGGVLGAPRNWTQFVHYDRATGLGAAGGYVGEGVAPSNLAGRTLADLITETDSDCSSLAWVNVPQRKWEPEPLRWLGVWGTRRIMMRADDYEFETGRESRSGRLARRLL